MVVLSGQFRLFVIDSLRPEKFRACSLSDEDFTKWKVFLLKESDSIRWAVDQHRWKEPSLTQEEVVKICDEIVDLNNIVFGYMMRSKKLWRNHPQAAQIKDAYLNSCNILENTVKWLSGVFTESARYIKISDYQLPLFKISLKQELSQLTRYLKSTNIDPDLTSLLLLGVSQLSYQRNIKENDVLRLRDLVKRIVNSDCLCTRQLVDLLIITDFNTMDFFEYCIKEWQNLLLDVTDLYAQRELLLVEKSRLVNLLQKSSVYRQSEPNIFSGLDAYLNEKSKLLKQHIKLRKKALKDQNSGRSGTRFLINLPVPQFGLFIRMQLENGILAKEHVGELFNFFAGHFYTAKTSAISTESLWKKSTDVEFATAKKLKGHLIGMLNWLNTNYNLSNYN
jgi:hypothetical protein